MKKKLKEYNPEQVTKLNIFLDDHIFVNANWAIPMMNFINNGDLPDDMIDGTPFWFSDSEEFYNYGKRNKDGEFDNTHPQPEFYECWIISRTMGNLLKKQGELVIDAVRYGCFWFRQATGQSISMDSVVQDAFADLL